MQFLGTSSVSRSARTRRLRVELLEDRRLLAVFTVDNLGDAGLGSLRQAILDANANFGADTVEFQAGLAGTIALISGEMLITDELTIDGPGAADLTIDAQQNSRIFHITPASGPVTFEGLSLTGGDVLGNGGAISSETSALLSVTGSTISGNSATSSGFFGVGGGIYANGDVSVTDSTISGNSAIFSGGGIFTFGDVTVTDSTISRNSADGGSLTGAGGGILARGNATVSSSTISGNFATGIRGGRGGGIHSRGDVTITDSTISGNFAQGRSSGGGGIWASGPLTVANSTISGNLVSGINSFGGGGIWALRSPVTIENSIVAGNQEDRSSPDLRPGTGPLTVRNSLIGDNTGTGLAPAPVGLPDANGNLIGTAASPIDPLLGPLQDNGGPTFTHALLAGSPAINAGDPAFVPPPDFDQRGDPFVRVFDGRIDMGAFEQQPVTLDERIEHLLDTGVLNRGQANSLLVKLNDSGNERAQLNRLRAFINEVNALVRAGILSAAEGQKLIDGAESLRMSLSVDAVLPTIGRRV